jgi:lipopolysaccharide biosynthesis glycosyltransferase
MAVYGGHERFAIGVSGITGGLAGDASVRIAFAINEDYCFPLTVAWHSLRATNPEISNGLQVDVLYEELSETSLERLAWHAERLDLHVTFRPIRLESIDYPTMFGGARAMYIRLAIPDIYDSGRVLYLDADLIVRGSLAGLLETDLNGAPIAAVRDPLHPLVSSGEALPGWAELGIPREREYFNSGVMLVDVTACRQAGIGPRALEFIAAHPEHIRLWEQDALNWAVEDHWRRLDRRWNAFPVSALVRTRWVSETSENKERLRDLMALEARAAILHYVTPTKPWQDSYPPGEAAAIYDEHMQSVLAADRESGLPSAAPAGVQVRPSAVGRADEVVLCHHGRSRSSLTEMLGFAAASTIRFSSERKNSEGDTSGMNRRSLHSRIRQAGRKDSRYRKNLAPFSRP